MATIRALDSATPPTASQVKAAKAAGYGAWLGYIGKPGDRLLNPWTASEFAVVTANGLLTGAYTSGNDDPTWIKQTASAYGIKVVILDCEAGIRGDGAWVPSWCVTAGAGLYGGSSVMKNHINAPIPFFVLAGYPESGTQTATWSATEAGCSTTKPTGWQWAGTVTEFGMSVDLSNFDSQILDPPPPPAPTPPPKPVVPVWRRRHVPMMKASVSDG